MSLPSESPISSTVQCPIADSAGGVGVVALGGVVSLDGVAGIGAPVENRHPAPGGLNAVMLT